MAVEIPFRQIDDCESVGNAVEVIRMNIALLVGQMESVNRQLLLGANPGLNVKRILTANQVSLCDVHNAIARLSRSLRSNDAT